MGKIIFILLILICGNVFSQTGEVDFDYANGNGIFIDRIVEDGNIIILRKHEQRFSIYPSTMSPYNKNTINVYAKPNSEDILFTLKDGDFVNTLQVANVKNISNGQTYWIKIKDDNNRIGWLDMDDNLDRYADGIWSIIEKIKVNGRSWTVRKLNGGLTVGEILNVRDNPGVNGTHVLFQLIPTIQHQELYVTILAITEEKDIIDGITDYWVKIKDEQNKIGWIFGGYTYVGRGGPKYRTPESQIKFRFNLP
ncbi:hypothetical protein FACS189485_14220 [Spirochaetia bacterium]|nr:hypothetical protein FACS189485_14220 [Spirochaetia bacterium]